MDIWPLLGPISVVQPWLAVAGRESENHCSGMADSGWLVSIAVTLSWDLSPRRGPLFLFYLSSPFIRPFKRRIIGVNVCVWYLVCNDETRTNGLDTHGWAMEGEPINTHSLEVTLSGSFPPSAVVGAVCSTPHPAITRPLVWWCRHSTSLSHLFWY